VRKDEYPTLNKEYPMSAPEVTAALPQRGESRV